MNIGLSPCICGKKFDGMTSTMRRVHVRECPQWREHVEKAAKDPIIRQRIKTEGIVAVARSLDVSDCALINAIRKADKLPRLTSLLQGKLSKPKEIEYSPEQVVSSIHWLITRNEGLQKQLREQTAELQQVRAALAAKAAECQRLLDNQLRPIKFAIDEQIKAQAAESR